jgi:transketolase
MSKDIKLIAENIREHVVDMTSRGNSSHVGSALSIVDIMAVLYGKVMHYDPADPSCNDRDRFILSKGHAGAAIYATLAEFNFFNKKILLDHYQNGSKLSGHVSHKGIPGVEISTGSLGHGLPIGVGISIALKKSNKKSIVYVLLSDGECDEGSNWEAILFAAHHGLSNLIVIVDYNKIQSLDTVENTIGLEPFVDKWQSFGWNVFEANGHEHLDLENKILLAKDVNGPSVVIAHTIKGYGVSFMENQVLWHYRSPQGEEYKQAKSELEKRKLGLRDA